MEEINNEKSNNKAILEKDLKQIYLLAYNKKIDLKKDLNFSEFYKTRINLYLQINKLLEKNKLEKKKLKNKINEIIIKSKNLIKNFEKYLLNDNDKSNVLINKNIIKIIDINKSSSKISYINYKKDNNFYDVNDFFKENNQKLRINKENFNFILCLKEIRYPVMETIFHKVFIFFYDKDFNKVIQTNFAELQILKGDLKFPKFKYKIKYNINIFKDKEIFVWFLFTSLNFKEEKRLDKKTFIWGFSLFKLNNSDWNIYIGHYQIPIYNPIYLKLDNWNFKKYYENNKFNRLILSSFLIYNIVNKNKYKKFSYKANIYNTYFFNPNKYEIELMFALSYKKYPNLYEIMDNLNIKIEDYYNKELDQFIQINNSLSLEKIYNFEIFNKNIKINLKIDKLVNISNNVFYMIEIYIIKEDKNNKKEYLGNIYEYYSKKTNSYIYSFKNNTLLINDISKSNDIIILEIYKLNKDQKKLNKEYIGWSILPIIINKNKCLFGKFSLPIIMNELNIEIINLIKLKSIWNFINNISNGVLNNKIKFEKTFLIITINEHIYNYFTDNLNDLFINNLFMPEIMKSIYIKYNKLKKKFKLTENNKGTLKNENIKELINFIK